jgi:endonuclease/exonuclease/phosphatase (EEP) superfamily protein YafD
MGRAVALAVSWVVVGALGAVSVFHLVHLEPRNIIVGLVAVTPWAYMLAWVTGAAGLVWDRRLAVLSFVLVGLQIWWVVPEFDPVSHTVRLPEGALAVRLVDQNVSQTNFNLSGLASEIEKRRPQLVAVEELTPAALGSLRATGAMRSYRYRVVRASWGSFGMALWSEYPLAGAKEWFAEGHPELRAWVEPPGRARFRLDVVHTEAPYGAGGPSLWAAEMGAIRRELAREPRPLVAVGDLNATRYDWHFQALLSLGLRDAANVAGEGWRMTWPANQQPVVPYLRIDHVLFSKQVSLEKYAVGGSWGSDHHSLDVTFSLGG